MYPYLRELLSDRQGGRVFRCFGPAHWCYILIVLCAAAVVLFYLRNKPQRARQRASAAAVHLAFALYIADFFLMPFAYGEIDIEKLPFHICTAMCVMCFLSRHNRFLGRFRAQFALLGFISNLVYLIYPAGIMWHQVHPFSYRVIQTLSFHGAMVVYGALALLYEDFPSDGRWHKNLSVILAMTLWAMLGNFLYTGEAYNFNWFFVRQDPFYLIPAHIAPWVMPIINVSLFLLVEMGVCTVCDHARRAIAKGQK